MLHKILLTSLLLLLGLPGLYSQEIVWNNGRITGYQQGDDLLQLSVEVPLFTFRLGEELMDARQFDWQDSLADHGSGIHMELSEEKGPSWKGLLKITNTSDDTLKIHNLVFLGEDPSRVHITGYGDHWLSRSRLFRPGLSSVPVILPDNAWEMGYSSISLDNGNSTLAGMCRRLNWESAQRRRFETYLFPGGTVEYELHAELFEGPWQNGLKMFFGQKYLYDLEVFDETLFNRPDLEWIRHKYVIHLIMAWDKRFFNKEDGSFHLGEFMDRGKKWYGGDDAIGIWPTWPSLGLDQRNQWDLFRDLPGGTSQLKVLARDLRSMGSSLFLCYNPWDESTRSEDQMEGLSRMIEETDADGVVLDTRGSSSLELQNAADKVKEGVIMYSEGMAITRDMPGIVSGRVHNALYYPPMLNLNKLIRPDFAIFRVAELKYERIRREYNLCLFNGYGVEINMFSPGQPDWIEEDYRYLGRIARVLRENTDNFVDRNWTPLVTTLKDSTYANHWPLPDKEIYTIYSMLPGGYEGKLLVLEPRPGWHYVDLWSHEELDPVPYSGQVTLSLPLSSFEKSYLGTNNEGAVGVVGVFRNLLETSFNAHFNELHVQGNTGTEIRIWAGDPSYEKEAYVVPAGDHRIDPYEIFGDFQGKFVIQLFDGERIMDERVERMAPGTPRLISKVSPTEALKKAPRGMVEIPSGTFMLLTGHGDEFISYPDTDSITYKVPGFFMDTHPVTNREFELFLRKSGYMPKDTARFLLHWKGGKLPSVLENQPVVHVSLEDAQAYAKWAGKRLPTELEWQYAAQAGDLRRWPWGDQPDSTRANPGNGILDEVGKYPEGRNPWGLEDLTGLVWQLTQDVYENGSYRYVMMKGGSYFKPLSSWWYVQGGPHELGYRQFLLLVSDGFERNATVGFRCVADSGK